MVFRSAASLLRTAVLPCLLITGCLRSPDALAGFTVEAKAGALLQTALPYLLGGLAGLVAGILLAKRVRNQPHAVANAAPMTPALLTTRWRDFVEVSADWLWETDADLRFISLPGVPAVPSIAPQDAVGRTWEEVIVPDLPIDFAIAHRDILARHGLVAVTLTRRSPSGETRYLELRGRPVFDAAGRFQGYRGIGREVTDKARLRDDLARNEERIHALIACSANGYWEQDADLRYTAITASSGHLADLAAEECIGSRRWDLPDVMPTATPWAEHITRLRQIEPFSNFVFKRLDSKGRTVWLSESGIPVFDRRGVFAGYCGSVRNVTAEIEAREQLQQEAARFRSLFDMAPINIGSISSADLWLEVSGALADFLGRSPGELVGTPVDAMLQTEDAATGKALRARCLAGETDRFTREVRYPGADGSLLWCREATRLIPGHAGMPPCFVVVIEDISAIRNTLDSRRAGEERYRQLFELSPEATLVCFGGRIQLVNAASRRLFGAPETHALDGIELLSLVHPDDRAMEAARLAQFEATPHQTVLPPLPLRYQRLDGTSINAEATGVRMHFEGRSAVLYVLRDVARWLSAEQVLRESRAMYRDVVESVNEILFQTDSEGRVSFLNRAWRHTTGFDSRLSIGQSLLEFVVDEDRVRVEQRLRAIRNGYDEIGQFEFRLRTQLDGPRWVEATIRPLLDTYDRVVGCSGTLDDITARKETEQSQRNLNRELEARVRVRTAELEASNRELEAFSYSVSHDLRAPLRAIDGFAQIVSEDYAPRLDETGREYLQRIRVATQRMARLIDDLIDLARLTRQTMKREQVNLSQIVEQILAELHQEDPGRRVESHVEPDLFAAADRALLRVALDNLLRNAWKFTSRREVAEIRFHAEVRDRQIVYCVSDNGAGFDMSFASKLFLPFHRLHGISEFAGTGIGLATVQRVIQRHEGQVWAISAPDQGASFFFTLSH
jgi:PAS domain S-box-containing protein